MSHHPSLSRTPSSLRMPSIDLSSHFGPTCRRFAARRRPTSAPFAHISMSLSLCGKASAVNHLMQQGRLAAGVVRGRPGEPPAACLRDGARPARPAQDSFDLPKFL